MKSFFIIIFLFVPSLVFGSNNDIYFCSETNSVGFVPKENYKLSKFTPKRFKIKVNFKNKTLKSNKLFFDEFPDWYTCKIGMDDKNSRSIYCSNKIGSTFSLNEDNLKFHYSYILNTSYESDTISLSHGYCEKF